MIYPIGYLREAAKSKQYLSIATKEMKICIPQIYHPDLLGTSSLSKFVQKFGGRITMVIYDSILAGKRILFSGDTKQNSVEEIQDYVFGCASLVSPPLYGILSIINPYVDLNSTHLLE